MKIASVIVDVPAMQTDRSFDYKIPDEWEPFIVPGMRVVVPFGPRKVQGFVVGLKEESDIGKLKAIQSMMDPVPVLTKELLELGFWMTKQTLAYAISSFQAMLPAAMKAKYQKEIVVKSGGTPDELPEEIREEFSLRSPVLWENIEKDKRLLAAFQKELRAGNLEVLYRVKDKAKTKTERYVKPGLSLEELEREQEQLPKQASKQKDVLAHFLYHPEPIKFSELLTSVGVSDGPLKTLIQKGLLQEEEVEVYRDPYRNRNFKKSSPFELTDEQKTAIAPILSTIEDKRHEMFLMHGVTGSGKTEVYMQSIDTVIKKGREAIVLVPEIALTPQMVERFKGRFGDEVAVLHSGLSTGEKYDEWRKIQRNEVKVVVGARSAIFAPFEKLGIIIIDEEHETSYKQEENPRYHAREVAEYRGKYHQCPVVLGSATPSLESFARAKKGVYHLLTMKERMNRQEMPGVNIIDMREELRSGNRSMFSRELFEKLKNRLEKGEQSVLFLNRRGFSTFVMCRDCGYVMECPHCDISLTYHKRHHRLKCHYCGFESPLPSECPECNSDHIRFFGTGTQKVEEELLKLLPEAKIIRMDVDTTRKKGAHEKLLTAFGEQQADILLGTQMIAKGLDFPNVTLVGVLAADTMLHLPDFRAAEKTFQLLTQVSGRAGRHHLPGEVIIQTYTPEHYSVELASSHDYLSYFEREMVLRRNHQYPPYYFLALINVSHPELTRAAGLTEQITRYIRGQLSDQAVILGPVSSPIPRIKDRYRYQCMIKYKNEQNLTDVLRSINDKYQREIQKGELHISIDMNPYMMM